VPFTLPPGTQNEAQFEFYVNSISMPQRLKGTVTYVAKVTQIQVICSVELLTNDAQRFYVKFL